jgi:hypothetical protein
LIAVGIRRRDNPPSLSVQVTLAEQRLLAHRQIVRTRISLLGQTLRSQMSSPAALLWAGGLGFAVGEFSRRQAAAPGTTERPRGALNKLVDRVLKLIAIVHALSRASPAADGHSEHQGPSTDPIVGHPPSRA